jgi:hypothetical protein
MAAHGVEAAVRLTIVVSEASCSLCAIHTFTDDLVPAADLHTISEPATPAPNSGHA